jgi:hypothetical protein
MRRILVLLAVALVMAALVVAMAMPAFADVSPNANCVGQFVAGNNISYEPGTGGRLLATAEHTFGPGAIGADASAPWAQPCV